MLKHIHQRGLHPRLSLISLATQWKNSMEDVSTHPLASEAPCSSSAQVEPSAPPAEVSPADLPLLQWTKVKECLSNGQWTQLLQDDQARDYLQHRCPVCYQWLATTTSIKYHLTMQHPEWSAAQPAVLKLLQGFRRHMVVPCRYCLQRQINKDRHWKQCHVLHICAFLAVHHGGDGQRPHGLGCSGAPVLDAGRTTEAGARREQVLCTGRARSDQEAEAGHAGQGQGQRQGSQRDKQGLFKVGPTKPGCGGIKQFVAGGLHRWFRRADDRSLALHSDRTSGDGGLTHRMNTLAQLVLRQEQTLASLRQDLVIYLFVRSGREGMVPVLCEAADKWRTLKETEPDKLTYSLKLAMFKQLLISLHQRLSETIKDKEAMERATSLNWVDEKQHWRHLNWSPVQQRLEIDQSLRPIPTEDLLTQLVQVRKAVTEESLLRFKSVKKLSKEVTADWIQFQICVSLRPEGGAIWSTLNQWIGQASWHMPVETRPSELRQPHSTGVESDVGVVPRLKALLRLVLHNPTNLCYLHSTIYAVCWTMLQARLHYASMPSLPQVFNLLCHAYQDSSSSHSGTVQVLRLLPWSIMLRAWRDVNRQQDVAEFTMYLLPRISPMGMCGRWEARNYVADDIVTLDSGSLEGPIPIHLHEGATIHLQRSIEGWSSQVRARYALCHAPQILCLQLMRFQQQGVSVRKDTRPLEGLSGVLHLPMYQGPRTLSTTLLPFQVAAVQHHYGESPVTGHYRSLLCGQNRFAEGRSWLTDDGKSAQIMPMDSHELCTTAYLIWLRQVNAI